MQIFLYTSDESMSLVYRWVVQWTAIGVIIPLNLPMGGVKTLLNLPTGGVKTSLNLHGSLKNNNCWG